MAQPFVVPEGVIFEIQDGGLVIENRGDVILHSTLGQALKRVISTEGAVEIHAPVHAESLQAAGHIRVHGDLEVQSVKAGSLEVGGQLKATSVDARGDISVAGATQVSQVQAGGVVAFGGVVHIGTVVADQVHFAGSALTARGVQGRSLVKIGETRLQVDAIIAPTVLLTPQTSGRATVVESFNDLGPNAIKGGFRLTDYAEMFGDPSSFLSERGLTVLDASSRPAREPEPILPRFTAIAPPVVTATAAVTAAAVTAAAVTAAAVAAPPAPPPVPPVAVAPVVAPPVPPAPPVAPATPPPSPVRRSVFDEPSIPTIETAPFHKEPIAPVAAPPPPPVSAPVDSIERAPSIEVEDVPPVSVESIDPVADDAIEADDDGPPVETRPLHPSHPQLEDAVRKVLDCYVGTEVPPAVLRLQSLVEERAYDQIRTDITGIWSELLKFHQKKGLRIQLQVTTTFNTINLLVKKM